MVASPMVLSRREVTLVVDDGTSWTGHWGPWEDGTMICRPVAVSAVHNRAGCLPLLVRRGYGWTCPLVPVVADMGR